MSETHEVRSDRFYLAIFGCLAVLTLMSFLVSENVPSRIATILIIMGVSTVKAFLVAAFFMHLNIDWTKVGFMVAGALVLATVLVLALIPDIVRAQRDPPNRPPVMAAGMTPAAAGTHAVHHE